MFLTAPVCWNWQTRRTQNPLVATPCGFKSHHRHQGAPLRPKGPGWRSFFTRAAGENPPAQVGRKTPPFRCGRKSGGTCGTRGKTASPESHHRHQNWKRSLVRRFQFLSLDGRETTSAGWEKNSALSVQPEKRRDLRNAGKNRITRVPPPAPVESLDTQFAYGGFFVISHLDARAAACI